MRKFYAGNSAQNVAEAKAARAGNGQYLGPAEVAEFEGQLCVEKWWIEKATGKKVQLASRVFVRREQGAWKRVD